MTYAVPQANTTTTDNTHTPGGAPGATVTRDANGYVTNVDLDGADAWQQRQNEKIAQSGFDYARTGNPNDLKQPAAPNPPAGPTPQQQAQAQQEAEDRMDAIEEEETEQCPDNSAGDQQHDDGDANDNYAD
jgi:hypothetical protein